MAAHVTILEDEEDLAELMALHLRREGYRVSHHADGAQGLAALERQPPDLLILDLMLPGLGGLDVCRRIRAHEELSRLPVLVVTARGEETDVVLGLELGADDYVVKPFSPRELMARVRALLRRAEPPSEAERVLRLGPIEVIPERHEARLRGEVLDLTHTEFGILHFLARRPGRVRGRTEILEAIGERHVLERTVDVHIAALRRKLGDAACYVETVRGVGYRGREG